MPHLDLSKIKPLMVTKGLREGQQITYQDIADGTGIHISTIERYANGRAKRPDPVKIIKIAEFFGVDREYFLEGDDLEGNKKAHQDIPDGLSVPSAA